MLQNTIASVKFTFGTELGPFLVTTGWFLILAKVIRNDHVSACSTARRSATEKIEIGGYVTVPCLSSLTQDNSTADWLKFWRRRQIDSDGTRTEQIFTPRVATR